MRLGALLARIGPGLGPDWLPPFPKPMPPAPPVVYDAVFVYFDGVPVVEAT